MYQLLCNFLTCIEHVLWTKTMPIFVNDLCLKIMCILQLGVQECNICMIKHIKYVF